MLDPIDLLRDYLKNTSDEELIKEWEEVKDIASNMNREELTKLADEEGMGLVYSEQAYELGFNKCLELVVNHLNKGVDDSEKTSVEELLNKL